MASEGNQARDGDGATPIDLATTYVHLGLGATVEVLRDFSWNEDALRTYEDRHAGDGDDGRLVMIGSNDSDWTTWECHPAGDELVVLLSGSATLVQERDDAVQRIELRAGDAVVNPRGVWHTLDVHEPTRSLYVTPGRGTEHRPR